MPLPDRLTDPKAWRLVGLGGVIAYALGTMSSAALDGGAGYALGIPLRLCGGGAMIWAAVLKHRLDRTRRGE